MIWKKPTYNDPFASVPNFPRITFNFILIGDGFTKEEIESGVYDLYCQEAMEGMESLEPFKTYSERFGLSCCMLNLPNLDVRTIMRLREDLRW